MPAKKEVRKSSEVEKAMEQSKASPAPFDSTAANVKDFFALEDQEADKDDSLSAYTTFAAVCQRLTQNLSRYGESTSPDRKRRLEEDCTLDLAMLRRLNRMSHFRNKRRRDIVAEERQKVDEQYLQLQNLLYEETHIEKEVNRCMEFKSAHEDIQLIPVDQFYAEAPCSVSKPDLTKRDAHQQRLARLTWELETRKILAEQVEKVQAEKEEIEKDIDTKLTQLNTLQPKLELLFEASRPLQEMLNMDYEKEAVQREVARYLPKPLFYAYIQGVAYKQVFDKNFVVSIDGDVERVKKQRDELLNLSQDDSSGDDSDSGESQRTSTNETSSTSKKKEKIKMRRRTVSEVVNAHVDDILSCHPLHLEFKIDCKNKATISIQLFYIPNLEAITIKSRLELKADIPRAVASAGDLLSDDTMLLNIFEKDAGAVCPNPTGVLKLDHFGINLASQVDSIGRPFRWAQHVAGLSFVRAMDDDDAALKCDLVDDDAFCAVKEDKVEGCNHLQKVLTSIKCRVLARLALQEQIFSLETLHVQTPKEVAGWFCEKKFTSLISWKSMTYEDFVHSPITQKLRDSSMVADDGWYFCASLERGIAKMTALVYINCDYPKRPPLFSLALSWNSASTADTSNFLLTLEQEVNVDCVQRLPRSASMYLLNVQLQYLISRLDVALEIESAQNSSADFPKEHLYSRLRRGRDREMPFEYNEDRNCFQFCNHLT